MDHESRILYVAPVDIMSPTGPGVNEREFLIALLQRFSNAVALLPEPEMPIDPALRKSGLVFVARAKPSPLGRMRLQARLARTAASLLRTHRPDLIVMRVGSLPLGQLFIGLLGWKVPIAIKTLGRGSIAGVRENHGPIAAISQKFMVRQLARRASVIDVVTPELPQHLSRELGLPQGRFVHIGNATNVERFTPTDPVKSREALGLSEHSPLIGFVGGRPTERGGRHLVEIVPRLVHDFPKLGVCVVGGSAREAEELQTLARRLGVEERCVIAGTVPYEDIPLYVNAFDVCLSMVPDAQLRDMGSSTQKVRQYLACGRPVVADYRGDHFVAQDGLGSLVNGSDLDAVADEVRKWLTLTEDEARQFSLEAAEYAREHLSVQRALDHRLTAWRGAAARRGFRDVKASPRRG
jgi:glycosyltransferase involved in cell wall biosynthesis